MRASPDAEIQAVQTLPCFCGLGLRVECSEKVHACHDPHYKCAKVSRFSSLGYLTNVAVAVANAEACLGPSSSELSQIQFFRVSRTQSTRTSGACLPASWRVSIRLPVCWLSQVVSPLYLQIINSNLHST
jgi:hypothetical protein